MGCMVLLSSCSSQPKIVVLPPVPATPPIAIKKPDIDTLLKNLAEQQSILPKHSPKLEIPLEKLASYYEVRSQYDLAEKYLEQMTVCHETNWNWERLSTALAEQEKFDQAIEAMKKSVAIIEAKQKDDNTAAVYIRYAKLLEKAGKQ